VLLLHKHRLIKETLQNPGQSLKYGIVVPGTKKRPSLSTSRTGIPMARSIVAKGEELHGSIRHHLISAAPEAR
jgi:hypothetical protein